MQKTLDLHLSNTLPISKEIQDPSPKHPFSPVLKKLQLSANTQFLFFQILPVHKFIVIQYQMILLHQIVVKIPELLHWRSRNSFLHHSLPSGIKAYLELKIHYEIIKSTEFLLEITQEQYQSLSVYCVIKTPSK